MPWSIRRNATPCAAALLSLGLLVHGIGCGDSESEPESDIDRTTEVEPGKSADGPFGTKVRAVDTSLDGPVQVEIDRTELPDSNNPLPKGTKAHGDAYRIAADRTLRTDPEAPFIFWLPKPEGANPENLGVAVHIGADEYDIRWAPEGPPADFEREPKWSIERAFVSESSVAFTLPQLDDEDGRVVTVVEEASLEPLDSSKLNPQKAQKLGPEDAEFLGHSSENFRAKCRSFGNAPETCGDSEEKTASETLARSYHYLRTLGYKKPSLANRLGLGPYVIRVKPCSQTDEGIMGLHMPATNHIWVCITEKGWTTGSTMTTRHEYMHATQYSYGNGINFPTFLKEGTAVASERSLAVGAGLARDPNRDGRRIDIPLKKENDDYSDRKLVEYRAQDFFLFVGKYLNKNDAGYLKKFYQNAHKRSLEENIDRNFGGKELSTLYWEWAKNRAIESQYQISNPSSDSDAPQKRPTEPCKFNKSSVDSPKEVAFSKGSGLEQSSFELPRLSGEVLRIALKPAAEDYKVTLSGEDQGGDTDAIKFYPTYQSTTSECFEQDTPHRRTFVVPNDDSVTVYALIVNPGEPASGTQQTTRTVELSSSTEPYNLSIDVTNPSDGSSHSEAGLVDFQADVEASAGVETIFWKTDKPGAYAFGEEVVARGEDPTPGGLCPATHTITATVTDERGRTASDTVTLKMTNEKPSIEFASPPPKEFYAGSFLPLKAKPEDQTCDSGPNTNDARPALVEWLWNGFEAGAGETYNREIPYSFAGGTVTVQATYTDESANNPKTARTKEASIDIVEPPAGGAPPTVQLTDPDDGRYYVRRIYYKGKAWGENGELSGNSLTWTFTDKTGETVTRTGESGDFDILDTDLGFGDVVVELTATDTEGRTETKSVEITVTPTK